MEKPRLRPYVTVVILLVLAALILAVPGRPTAIVPSSVRPALPERVGRFTGHDPAFCQNENCLQAFLSDELEEPGICPACGGPLADRSLAESRILPKDTLTVKKHYVDGFGQVMSVSMVLSGREHRSIHRPQMCLPAQGYVIEGSRTVRVPIEGRAPLQVRLLDLRAAGKTLAGRPYLRLSAYAYWFVGNNRETPSHLARLFWMGWDRVFRNVSPQWAYVAVATDRQAHDPDHVRRLSAFLADLYPLIVSAPDPAK